MSGLERLLAGTLLGVLLSKGLVPIPVSVPVPVPVSVSVSAFVSITAGVRVASVVVLPLILGPAAGGKRPGIERLYIEHVPNQPIYTKYEFLLHLDLV